MSAKSPKKAAAKAAGPSTIFMICKAIGAIKSGNQGASRAAIANFICKNYKKEAGARFNATLRNAIKKGIEAGIIRAGATAQRFKLGEKAKSVTNPPKPKKKKKVTKKKKPAKKSKKKKTTKKKVTKKKKTASKKKKITKKKPAKKTTKKKTTKKKTVTKKKPAKKSAKKKTTKKKTTKRKK